MADEGEAKRAPTGPTPFRGWPAVGCVVLLVLFAGIVAVQFVPVERLHGWPSYIGWAFLLMGAAIEVLLLGGEIVDWVLRVARDDRGEGSE